MLKFKFVLEVRSLHLTSATQDPLDRVEAEDNTCWLCSAVILRFYSQVLAGLNPQDNIVQTPTSILGERTKFAPREINKTFQRFGQDSQN